MKKQAIQQGRQAEKGDGVTYMVMKGDLTLDGEHTVKYMEDVL